MERIYRGTLLALYQLTLLVGILMMPLALVTRKAGIRMPMDRILLGLKGRYEQVQVS